MPLEEDNAEGVKIGTGIKSVRKKLGYSQKDFAKKVDMNNSYLSLIERNKRLPSLEMIAKISKILNVPLAVLFWFSVTEEDLAEDRKALYPLFKPSIDSMLLEMFDTKENE